MKRPEANKLNYLFLTILCCLFGTKASAGIISYSETVSTGGTFATTYVEDSQNGGYENASYSAVRDLSFTGFDETLGELQSVEFSWNLAAYIETTTDAWDTVADGHRCFLGCRYYYNDVTSAAAWYGVDIGIGLGDAYTAQAVDRLYRANYSTDAPPHDYLRQNHEASNSAVVSFNVGNDADFLSYFTNNFDTRIFGTLTTDLFCTGQTGEMMCTASDIVNINANFSINYLYDDGTTDIVAVPEPNSVPLIALGFAGLLLARRNRS